MDRERIVGVRRTGGSPGSGYLVGPDLVLTSAHVVGPAGDEANLFLPGRSGSFRGRVVWRGTPGGRDDAALVQVTSATWVPAAGRPVRWGHLVTDSQSAPCRAWGLPDAFQQAEYAETAQPTGRINPGDRMVGNRYVMNLDDPLDAVPDAAGSPWGGLSGAALFSGDLLVGVIAQHPAKHRRRQLEAVPAYVLMHNGDFRAALDAHTGPPPGHARGWAERLLPVEWQRLADTGALAAAGGRPSASPAALLLARNAVVPFRGRTELLDQLTAWARQPGFGATLVHGPGGQGKTRLAHHLGSLLGARGHVVLWPGVRAREADLEALKDSARPLLLVVDYAETRIEQLAALLDAAAARVTDKPFKLLLLARTAESWWEELAASSQTAETLLEGARTALLPVLEDSEEGRRAAYREAVGALAGALPRVPGQQEHDWAVISAGLPDPAAGRLGDGSALTLHMTALADLLDTADPPGPDPGPARQQADGVEDRLLRHETRYWKGSAVAAGLLGRAEAALPPALTDSLTAAFLLGAHDRSEADTLLGRIPALGSADRAHGWLAGLYPPEFAGQPWGSLQPDRLAERFVGRRLAANPELADRLMVLCTDRQAAQLVTVYARAAAHPVFRGALDAGLTALCSRHEDVLTVPAMRTATRTERPGPLLAALWEIADRPGRDLGALLSLSLQIPGPSEVLAPWSAHVAHLVVLEYQRSAPVIPVPAGARTGTRTGFIGPSVLSDADAGSPGSTVVRMPTDVLGYLRALGVLSHRLDSAGQSVEAAEVGLEALRFAWAAFKAVTSVDNTGPDADWRQSIDLLAEVADTMLDHAVRAELTGRDQEALPLAEPAVWLLRRLNEELADHVHDGPRRLALALGRLAVIRAAAGQREQALADMAESNRLLRDRMRPDEADSVYALAVGLSAQASLLSRFGSRNTARQVAGEAVALHRAAAEQEPDAYRHGLVTALSQLADILHAAMAWDEAATVREEAVAHARHLMAARPAAYAPVLAAQLTGQASQLGQSGHHQEAFTTLEEAVGLLREAYRTHPERYAAELAACLHTQGTRLNAAGVADPARAALEEAVGLWRPLAREAPTQYGMALAQSLVGLGHALQLSGRAPEGARWVRKGLALLRRHERTHPDDAAWPLAAALTMWAVVLSQLAQHGEALAAATEAVVRYRRLVDGQSAAGESAGLALAGLANTLITQCAQYAALDRYPEALQATTEAADLLDELAAAEPLTFLPLWATAEANRGIGLLVLGSAAEGIAALEAAAEARWLLAAAEPALHLAPLAVNLTQLAGAYEANGRRDEARSAAQEAIQVYEQLVPHVPQGYYDEELQLNRQIRARME
ncbi:trypsin-like peptidase domain-containing protein [Streptomyces sp. NPDC059989]|uniref:trypsin-like peptidase domain-containing protein n=1 Tax=Streptomyces sp. NPDC059989 TaxID=3347026 RepID=UPI0036BC79A3